MSIVRALGVRQISLLLKGNQRARCGAIIQKHHDNATRHFMPEFQQEATSPDSGTKDQRERGRGAARGEGESSPPASPASHASPPPDDIEHSIPATLIQDPNAERSPKASFSDHRLLGEKPAHQVDLPTPGSR
ncbi:unnamed protein product [Pieris macdunnoughi]|uniref:Uncharacterized protein n=1 Tax=Pieris macdunnoughi TaxID=345717 RepID=A0A821YF87_9NEOP|nr:unnamed protein product [Pieris macdunnoughi]